MARHPRGDVGDRHSSPRSPLRARPPYPRSSLARRWMRRRARRSLRRTFGGAPPPPVLRHGFHPAIWRAIGRPPRGADVAELASGRTAAWARDAAAVDLGDASTFPQPHLATTRTPDAALRRAPWWRRAPPQPRSARPMTTTPPPRASPFARAQTPPPRSTRSSPRASSAPSGARLRGTLRGLHPRHGRARRHPRRHPPTRPRRRVPSRPPRRRRTPSPTHRRRPRMRRDGNTRRARYIRRAACRPRSRRRTTRDALDRATASRLSWPLDSRRPRRAAVPENPRRAPHATVRARERGGAPRTSPRAIGSPRGARARWDRSRWRERDGMGRRRRQESREERRRRARQAPGRATSRWSRRWSGRACAARGSVRNRSRALRTDRPRRRRTPLLLRGRQYRRIRTRRGFVVGSTRRDRGDARGWSACRRREAAAVVPVIASRMRERLGALVEFPVPRRRLGGDSSVSSRLGGVGDRRGRSAVRCGGAGLLPSPPDDAPETRQRRTRRLRGTLGRAGAPARALARSARGAARRRRSRRR